MQVGDWRGTSAPEFSNDVLELLGVDDYITRVYQTPIQSGQVSGPMHQLGLYVGYYLSQRQGDTIHSPMNCLPGAGWQPMQVGTLDLPAAGAAAPLTVNRVVIHKGEEKQLVLYWYQGRGRVVANEYVSKALLVWDAGLRNRSDGALVRVISPMLRTESGPGGAEARAVQFSVELQALLSRFLPS